MLGDPFDPDLNAATKPSTELLVPVRHLLDQVAKRTTEVERRLRCLDNVALYQLDDPFERVVERGERRDPARQRHGRDDFVDHGIAEVQLRGELVKKRAFGQVRSLEDGIDAARVKPVRVDLLERGGEDGGPGFNEVARLLSACRSRALLHVSTWIHVATYYIVCNVI